MTDYTTHNVISGKTKSGKTTLATFYYVNLRGLRVFFNTQYEPQVERVSHAICNDIKGFRTAIERGYRKICFNPDTSREKAKAQLYEIIDCLFSIGKEINKEGKRVVWCYLFIDEIHLYSSKRTPDEKIDMVWTAGSRYGVIGFGITQRPALVSHTILTQSTNHISFLVASTEQPYFKRYGIPIEEHEDWIRKPYHFVIFDQANITEHRPISYPIEV